MRQNREDGFIAKIVRIIVALIALKYYFHFDFIEWLKSPSGQNIVGPTWSVIKSFYDWLDNLVKGWVGK
jgi:hypothetical protein